MNLNKCTQLLYIIIILWHTFSVAVLQYLPKMICVIVVLLLVHSVSSIPIGDFLPFNGPNVCLFDTVTMLVHKSNTIGSDGLPIDEVNRRDCEEFRLSPNDDGSSPNISIGFTFPFFARRFRNLYVSTAYR